MPLATKDSKILIVGGGGTIGSSTALHLARRGYTDIRLLDKFENPSANSAGNDMNKIGGNDSAGIWGELGAEAWHMWKTDPVFKAHSHENGRLDATSEPEREARLRARYEAIVAEGRGDIVEWVKGRKAIVEKLPHLAKSKVDDSWRGLWVKQGGWVAARNALNSVGIELRRLGVKTSFGSSGTFASLLLSADGKTCVGVKAADGTEWPADLVVFAAGAWSPTLLDLEGQCVSKAWVFGHVQLTPKEAEELKGIPTMYHNQLGFYMEPQPGTGVIKLVNEFAGYTHNAPCRPFPLKNDVVMSVPRSHAENPTDTFPTECEDAIKRLVDTCLPHLSGRPLIDRAMCWCTDTVDAQWLLCEYPKFKGVVLATGDSGHTFKMFPVVGKQVADLIEDKLPADRKHLWRWRPAQGDDKGMGRGGPEPKDLQQVEGWRHDGRDGILKAKL